MRSLILAFLPVVLTALSIGSPVASAQDKWTQNDLSRVRGNIKIYKDTIALLKKRAAGQKVTDFEGWWFLRNRLLAGGVKDRVLVKRTFFTKPVTLFTLIEQFLAPTIAKEFNRISKRLAGRLLKQFKSQLKKLRALEREIKAALKK